MIISDFGMRISEFIKVLKSHLFNPQSTIRNPQLLRYLSLGQQCILFVLAVCLLGFHYFKFDRPSLPLPEAVINEFMVEIVGEVRKLGVYIFQHSPNLKEAIERAGGLKESVQFDTDSSSEILNTGALITIQKITPSPLTPACTKRSGEGRGEGGPARRTNSLAGRGGGEQIRIKIGRMDANKLLVFNIPLDLNRVTAGDLCLLPGIGESLAREIVAYREKRKGFRSVVELKQVKGIGEKKYQSIQSYLTTNIR